MSNIHAPHDKLITLGSWNSFIQADPSVLQLISSLIEGFTRGQQSATRDLMLSARVRSTQRRQMFNGAFEQGSCMTAIWLIPGFAWNGVVLSACQKTRML